MCILGLDKIDRSKYRKASNMNECLLVSKNNDDFVNRIVDRDAMMRNNRFMTDYECGKDNNTCIPET